MHSNLFVLIFDFFYLIDLHNPIAIFIYHSFQLDDLLETSVKIIEGQMRVEPHRFMGANGSWVLVGQYLIVWVTTIGAVLGIAGIKTST